MKINLLDIETEDDRQRALTVLLAFEPVPAPVEAAVVVPEPPVEAPEPPVEAAVAVPEPPAADVKKPRRARKANGAAEPDPVDPSPAPVEADEEAVREQLRQITRTNGVIWLREILTNYSAQRLSDLTSAQVQEVLNDQAQ